MEFKFYHYESQIATYKQQIADFDRLSRIASDNMLELRQELEIQTKKLRLIEERWRDEKTNPELNVAIDTTKIIESIKEEQALFWKKIIEGEEIKWKSSLMENEQRLAKYLDRISYLESTINEKEHSQRLYEEKIKFITAQHEGFQENQQKEIILLKKVFRNVLFFSLY